MVIIEKDKQEPDISEYTKVVQANEVVEDPESRLFFQRQSKEPDHGRIKDINTRLEQIKVDFEANLANDGSGIWLSKAKLDGVPRDVINSLIEDFGFYEGKLFVKFSTYRDVLLYTINPNTCKKLYIVAENRVRNLPNNLCFIVLLVSLT